MKKTLLFLCLGISSMLVFAGCNKEEPIVEEPVVEEVNDETVEVVDTTDLVEEDEPAEVDVPKITIKDENGEVYVAPEITADDIYAQIDNITEKYQLSDYERDHIIMTILYYNGAKMSDEEFNIIREDYLGNVGEATCSDYINSFRHQFISRNNEISLSDLLINEEEKKIADQIEEYYNSDSFTDEEWRQIYIDYTNEVYENNYGSSLGIILCDIYDAYDVDFVCDIDEYGGHIIDGIVDEYNINNRSRFDRNDYPSYDNSSEYESSHQE